jgi:hypothetical protein
LQLLLMSSKHISDLPGQQASYFWCSVPGRHGRDDGGGHMHWLKQKIADILTPFGRGRRTEQTAEHTVYLKKGKRLRIPVIQVAGE